jgi:hypothetical protein
MDKLYGVAGEGGGTGCFMDDGCGAVFKLSRTGALILLHRFAGFDGNDPLAKTRNEIIRV